MLTWLAPIAAPVNNLIAANNAAIEYSDHSGMSHTTVAGFANAARFTRAYADPNSQGFDCASPGARMRFRSDAPNLNIVLFFNTRVTYAGVHNSVGAVYVDGVLNRTFQSPLAAGTATIARVNLAPGSSSTRLYELILPYNEGVDVLGIEQDPDYTISAPSSARTGIDLCCFGDSITHGFSATGIKDTWFFKLIEAKGWTGLNLGYGSQRTVQFDGTAVGNQTWTRLLVMGGYNDFVDQTSGTTVKDAVKTFINAVRARPGKSSSKIYVSSTIYSPNTNTTPLSTYRTAYSDAVTELADANTIYIDGLSIMTNNSDRLTDTVHPNDTGSAEMATGFAGAVT